MSNVIFELFSTLTKGARAALPFLRAAAEGTKTANEIIEEAKGLGFAFRRQAGLDIIGTLRNNIDARRSIRITPLGIPLNPASFGLSIGKLKRTFSHTVDVIRRNVSTGTLTHNFITVSTNDLLTQNEILSNADAFVPTSGGDQEESIESMRVVDSLKDSSVGSDVGPYDPLGLLNPNIQP